MKRPVKILLIILSALTILSVVMFISSSASFTDIYRGADETTVWIKLKFLPLKKEISRTDSYKFEDLMWSPDGEHLAYYDNTREEICKKEWELKVFDPRLFKTKTVFIGDWKTGEYKWIDNNIIRVYENAGTGVRIYRDIDIDADIPFVASDYMSSEYWMPEITFTRSVSVLDKKY
jgi:hypothetical protein